MSPGLTPHLNLVSRKVLTLHSSHYNDAPRINLFPSDTAPFHFHLKGDNSYSSGLLHHNINKAQDQTMKKVGIYMYEPVFSHGQLNVASSRARSFDQLKVHNISNKAEERRIRTM